MTCDGGARHGKSKLNLNYYSRTLIGGVAMSSVSAVPLPNVGARSISLMPASFRQRVGAGLIDYVLTGIVVFSLGKLCSTSKSIATIGVVPLA